MTVSRDDLERKAQELAGAVDSTAKSVENTAVIAAVAIGVVVVASFFIGRRRGNRNKTVVEVYKV